jgi:GDP-4-dehydro-6-deoxy-D-mannose reductase
VLARLIALGGVAVRVEPDPALTRAVTVPCLVGSHARATAQTGWRPEIPLDRTLTDVLAEWRNRAPG